MLKKITQGMKMEETTPKKEDNSVKALITFVIGFSVFILCAFLLAFTCSCQFVPEIAKSIEDIATDDAVTVKCDKDCFSKGTDVKVNVEITNKLPPER